MKIHSKDGGEPRDSDNPGSSRAFFELLYFVIVVGGGAAALRTALLREPQIVARLLPLAILLWLGLFLSLRYALLQPPATSASHVSSRIEQLRAAIEGYLNDELRATAAQAAQISAVFNHIKRRGDSCVSQIALDTGLPLTTIFCSLRHLLTEGLAEWRPDRDPNRIYSRVETSWSIPRYFHRKSYAIRVGDPLPISENSPAITTHTDNLS